MGKLDSLLSGLMWYAVIAVCLDTALPLLFPDVEVLQNFSLVQMFIDAMTIIASLVLLAAYTIERLTVGDILSPLSILIRMIMAFAFIFIGGAVDFFFDIVVLPFHLISDLANDLNIATGFSISEIGQYVSFDLSTFTLRVGFKLSLFGNGARATFQLSLLGAEEFVTPNKGFTFPEMGFVGGYARLRLSAVGVTVKSPPFKMELESFIKGIVDAVFKNVGSAEQIYQELLEALKDLGWA